MDFHVNTKQDLKCHNMILDSNCEQRDKLLPRRSKRNLVGVNTKQNLKLTNLDLKLTNPNLKLSIPLKNLKLSNPEVQGNVLQNESENSKELLSNTISCKRPKLFNKELLPKTSTNLKPSLFSDILLSNGNLQLETTDTNIHDRSPNLLHQNVESLAKKHSGNKEKKQSIKMEKKLKRKRKKVKGDVVKEKVSKLVNVEAPVYGIEFDVDIKLELEEIRKKLKSETSDLFVENKDESDLKKLEKEKTDRKKVTLINMVSIALLNAPNINDVNDKTRQDLMKRVKEVAELDPEFVLKVALYTRRILNVRTVSIFILAFAAYLPETRPYFRKYFKQSIVLPSDWISVGEFYQTFFDSSMKVGALPTCLRKAMTEKFTDFDEYQLAKYNKDKGKVKTKTVTLLPESVEFLRGMSLDEDGDMLEEHELKSLSLKQLIRKLHISEPAYHVMCLVGKKYPTTVQEFYRSHLPGIFEEEKAGLRMRLKIPETWETQVSLKGNKASTWQDLIDHKRLPFMAMLRNLRNMIQACIKDKYHDKIIHRLTDQRSVINSKQFPFRFLSAYDVINEMGRNLDEFLESGEIRGPRRHVKGNSQKAQAISYTHAVLKRYKKALETALKISTIHNISPIPGTTVIIIDVEEMTASRILTKSISNIKRSALDMCLLIGMMCKFHCEDCQLIINDSAQEKYFTIGELDSNNILNNVHKAKEMVQKLWSKDIGTEDLSKLLFKNISQKKKIDNFLMVGGEMSDVYLDNCVKLYRKEVNPICLAVRVSLETGSGETKMDGGYDVMVHGFSDQVLRYISERGSGRQLIEVENVDMTFNLQDIKIMNPLKANKPMVSTVETVYRPLRAWRTVRVFISSTFRDMHGERDLLTRYIIPELRFWCFNYCLNLYEVDLRWGITEKQSQSEKQMEICLREVMKCDLFVGIVGERFGWVPDSYNVDDNTGLEWLKDMPVGCSMTELEMRGFLQKDKSSPSKALFFFRDSAYLNEGKIPEQFIDGFISSDIEHRSRLQALKKDILRTPGISVYENYPCKWGGVVDGQPFVSDLDEFGHRVLNQLWSVIKRNYIAVEEDDVEIEEAPSDKHVHFASEVSKKFVGRSTLLQKALSVVNSGVVKENNNVLLITGKTGSGKTAFMAELVKCAGEMKGRRNVCFFPEAGPQYQNRHVMLKVIFSKLNNAFDFGMTVPDTYKELKVKIEDIFKMVSKSLFRKQCCVFIDGMDQLDTSGVTDLTEWIPDKLPKGLLLVISCTENSTCYRSLSTHRQKVDTIKVGALEHADRANFVRKILSQHGKELDESAFNNQMRLLLSKKGAESPLYLKLACEELRMFGVYEKLNDYLRKLAQTTPQLTEFILQRVEMQYGKELLKNVFSILYFARHGLTEDDLYKTVDLLQNIQGPPPEYHAQSYGIRAFFYKHFLRKQIPHSYFLRMCREIKVFLQESTENGLISLGHKDIIDIVERSYAKPAGAGFAATIHMVLASLFCKQADPNDDSTWQGRDLNVFTELPYHMAASGLLWTHLSVLLTSADFIKSSIEGGMCVQLLETLRLDLPIIQKKWLTERNKFIEHDDIKDITEFISNKIHILKRYPKMFVQLAVNSRDGSYVQKMSQSFKTTDVSNVVKWVNKPLDFSNCLLTISNIQTPVMCVSLSRDDKMVACGTSDGTVFVYEKSTGKVFNAFYGHTSAVTSCCYADRNRLCSASADGSLAVWNLQDGNRLFLLKKHTEAVTGCVVTSDGLLISVSLDNTAVLWSLSDGKEAGELSGFEYPFNCVALSKNEKHAALGGWNRAIVVWNILENKRETSYKGHKSSVRSLAYSPNGRYLASSSLDGEILLWSTLNGAKVGQLSSHSSPVQHLQFTAKGLQLVGACTDTSVKVWAGSFGCPDSMYADDNLNDEQASTTGFALSVCVCDRFVAVGYNNGKVCVFDNTRDRNLLFTWSAHKSSVRSMSFIKCVGSEFDLLTASDDHTITRWKLCGVTTPTSVEILLGHTDGVLCVRAKEAVVISSSRDYTVRVWPGLRMDTGADKKRRSEPIATLHGHTGIVTCCDLSPCETKAVSSSFDRALYIWDLNTYTSLCVVHNAHSDGVTSCCWSDVGTYVITASNDFLLKLWNTKVLIEKRDQQDELKPRVTFTGHTTTINDVKYKFGCVSSASADGALKIWTHNGIEITSLKPHQKRINCCELWAPVDIDESSDLWSSFDPEKKSVQQKVRAMKPKSLNDVLVYTASDDGTVEAWRPFKPNLLRELYDHSDEVRQVACSSTSENEIVSCSADESLKVWSFAGQSLADGEKATHAGSVTCLALHGISLLATGGFDGYVYIYEDKTLKNSLRVSLTDSVTALKFLSPNLIVTGCGDGDVAVRNIKDGGVVASVTCETSVLCMTVKAVNGIMHIIVSTCLSISIFKLIGTTKLEKCYQTSKPRPYQNKFNIWARDNWDHTLYTRGDGSGFTRAREDNSGDGIDKQYYCYPSVDIGFVGNSLNFVATAVHTFCHFYNVQKLLDAGGDFSNEDRTSFVRRCEQQSAAFSAAVKSDQHFTYLFTGLANGKLSLEVRRESDYAKSLTDITLSSSKQVHSGSVTGVLVFNDVVITSSIDATLKIWKWRIGSDLDEMTQIGLFCCRSSVMSLQGAQTNEGISLFAGDRIGNVEFLSLTTASSV